MTESSKGQRAEGERVDGSEFVVWTKSNVDQVDVAEVGKINFMKLKCWACGSYPKGSDTRDGKDNVLGF